jgi:putative endonuclease
LPALKKPRARKRWIVYILRCADGSLYTGVTRDITRRVLEHNSNARLAARYTRSRRPVVLVYQETAGNRASACRREYRIKQLARSEKEKLVRGKAKVAGHRTWKVRAEHRKSKVKRRL